MQQISEDRLHEIVTLAATKAAEAAVEKVFSSMGIDLTDAEDRRAWFADQEHLRKSRLASEGFRSATKVAVITAMVPIIGGLLYVGLSDAVKALLGRLPPHP